VDMLFAIQTYWMPFVQGMVFTSFILLILIGILLRVYYYAAASFFFLLIFFEIGFLNLPLAQYKAIFFIFLFLKYVFFLLFLLLLRTFFSKSKKHGLLWNSVFILLVCGGLGVVFLIPEFFEVLLFIIALSVFFPLLGAAFSIFSNKMMYKELVGSRIGVIRNIEKIFLFLSVIIYVVAFYIDLFYFKKGLSGRFLSNVLFAWSGLFFVIGMNLRIDALRPSSELSSLRKMAYWDDLTAIMNRRASAMYLERSIQDRNTRMAVFFIDINKFKYVNDHYGYQQGDLVLRSLAVVLKRSTRKDDFVFRFGGDEFLILLRNLIDTQDTLTVLQRIQTLLKEPLRIKGNRITMAVRIGVAFFPEDGTSREELLQKASNALLQAKKKSLYVYFHNE